MLLRSALRRRSRTRVALAGRSSGSAPRSAAVAGSAGELAGAQQPLDQCARLPLGVGLPSPVARPLASPRPAPNLRLNQTRTTGGAGLVAEPDPCNGGPHSATALMGRGRRTESGLQFFSRGVAGCPSVREVSAAPSGTRAKVRGVSGQRGGARARHSISRWVAPPEVQGGKASTIPGEG